MKLFQIVILSLSSLALLYASSMRLINPKKANFLKAYLSNPENELENDIDLVNEIRGIGAVMLLGGIAILLGAIIPDLRLTSFIIAIVIFLGIVSGRSISFILDGKPNKAVIKATIAEVFLSVLNIFCLINILI